MPDPQQALHAREMYLRQIVRELQGFDRATQLMHLHRLQQQVKLTENEKVIVLMNLRRGEEVAEELRRRQAFANAGRGQVS